MSFTFQSSPQNPYLPLWEHLPDGEPRVFEDPDQSGKFRVYIIGSHDLRVSSYCGVDIRMWSAPVEDVTSWTDHGPIFTYQDPITQLWDVMYAPDLVEIKRKDGTKEYYLYPHSRGPGREPMVCKSTRPDGPFEAINVTEDGKCLPGSMIGFDPSVYIDYITDESDPDYETGFRAYAFWGFQKSHAAQLDPQTMYSVRPGTEVIHYFMPASSKYGEIRDPEGTVYPHVHAGEDLKSFNFFEAFSMRKIGNKYVAVFSGYSGPDYGLSSTNSALRYAYADTPLGPFRSGGVLVDSRAPVLGEDGKALITSATAHNTHGSVEQINDQWYAFYHRPPRGAMGARQAVVEPIVVQWDDDAVSQGGQVRIFAYNPYADNMIYHTKALNGDEYKGAQVTSEGFSAYGLPPHAYYSAGIACFLSHPETLQDSYDIWDNHMPITNVSHQHIIGFKHFGFGGLAQHTKGLSPFDGTRVGDNTNLQLFLKVHSTSSFTIHVYLDAPWNNDVHHGKHIGSIKVQTNNMQDVLPYTLDVAKYVENLDKKHALYLVVEGADVALFDFIGIGFGANKKTLTRKKMPVIAIKANEILLDLPEKPLSSTHENGITGYGLYEVGVAFSGTEVPVITASATSDDVSDVIGYNISDAPAPYFKQVCFDYNGITKTYLMKQI